MIKALFFKLGYGFRVHRFFKPGVSSGIVTVLCLHRVNPIHDSLFPPLTPAVFADVVRLLKKEYAIMGFAEWQSSPPKNRPALILSFDDGYKDFIEFAMPVIRKEKIAVNHNIVINSAETGQLIWTQRFNNLLSWLFKTGQALEIEYENFSFHQPSEGIVSAAKGKLFKHLFSRPYTFCDGIITSLEKKYSFEQPANEMMNWNDIITCDKEGVEIGSHTMYHSSLAEHQDDAFMQKEIAGSKKILEEKLQHPVDSFAFPNGWAHPVAYQMAVDAGYKNLLLIDGVKYPFNLKPKASVYPYKRLLVGHSSVYENIFNIAGFHKALKRQ